MVRLWGRGAFHRHRQCHRSQGVLTPSRNLSPPNLISCPKNSERKHPNPHFERDSSFRLTTQIPVDAEIDANREIQCFYKVGHVPGLEEYIQEICCIRSWVVW